MQTQVSCHLEHNQVVVMTLNLEDVGQSHHSCFKFWRITCQTQTNDDFILLPGQRDDEIKEKRTECEKSKVRGRAGEQRNVSTYCRGWWEGPLICCCYWLPAAHSSYTFPLRIHKTQPYTHNFWIMESVPVCHVRMKMMSNMFFNLKNNLTVQQKGWWAGIIRKNIIPCVMSPSTGHHQYVNTHWKILNNLCIQSYTLKLFSS